MTKETITLIAKTLSDMQLGVLRSYSSVSEVVKEHPASVVKMGETYFLNQATSNKITHLDPNRKAFGDVYNFRPAKEGLIKYLFPTCLSNVEFDKYISYHESWTLLFDSNSTKAISILGVYPICARFEFLKAFLSYINASSSDFFLYSAAWGDKAFIINTNLKNEFDRLEDVYLNEPTSFNPDSLKESISDSFTGERYRDLTPPEKDFLKITEKEFTFPKIFKPHSLLDKKFYISQKGAEYETVKDTIIKNEKYFSSDKGFMTAFKQLTQIDKSELENLLALKTDKIIKVWDNINSPKIEQKNKSTTEISELGKRKHSSSSEELKEKLKEELKEDVFEQISTEHPDHRSRELTVGQWEELLTSLFTS